MRTFLVLLAVTIAGCSGNDVPPFEVTDIEITEPLPARSMSAGFMTLANNTDGPIVITEVRSPDYGSVQIHESSIEDGVARMRRIAMLEVPAESETVLERGGLHLMLMQARGNPDAVTLTFFTEDTLLVEVRAKVARRAN